MLASKRAHTPASLSQNSRQGVAIARCSSRRGSQRSKPRTALGKPLRLRPNGVGERNLYGYVLNDPVNLIDPAGLQTFGCFRRNFENNLDVTNDFFFTFPTQLSRTAIGAVTSGAVARTTGLTNLGMAARALARGTGAANLTIAETLGSLALNTVVNGALVATTLEGGIIAGSAASALGQALAGECPPEPQPQCTQ